MKGTQKKMLNYLKKPTIINTTHWMLGFMDETVCKAWLMLEEYYLDQIQKIYKYIPGTLQINIVWFMGVNCNSYMETNNRGDLINFVKALCHFKIENMHNDNVKQLIDDAITNFNLKNESNQRKLAQNSLNWMKLINKLI